MTVEMLAGDCLEILPTLAGNSVDSCVTDPPYHLTNNIGSRSPNPGQYTPIGEPGKPRGGFMGKQWDGGDIAFRPEVWREVYRVLKPGAHLLAFGGTRTYHRMACAIEDAGFEIRDTILYLYGSGFPKSHSVTKGAGDAICTCETPEAMALQSQPQKRGAWPDCGRCGKPIVPDGLGTALKPACEPIVLARKPLSEGTVAANVLRWGTGAINIDATRIPLNGDYKCGANGRPSQTGLGDNYNPASANQHSNIGRWPANLILDGGEEVLAGFPESGNGNGEPIVQKRQRNKGWCNASPGEGVSAIDNFGDSGSAARFFYTAKAGSDDRLGSKHPTVKPLDLMQYLVRLVTPKGGLVLDPFAGTGTTGEAAFREGMNAVLIEREAEYQADIKRRITMFMAGPEERAREAIKERMKDKPRDDGPLFA